MSIDDTTPKDWDKLANNSRITPEPPVTANEHPAVWSLVIRDMADRDVFGANKYGTRLQPSNGRKTLNDAYQEALDLVVYLRQEIYERDGH